jgi:hypothetical protein
MSSSASVILPRASTFAWISAGGTAGTFREAQQAKSAGDATAGDST